jgi:flagellar basal body P-ring formation protein FlgA
MWRFVLLLCPLPALADSLVATRTLRAHTTVAAEDVTLVEAAIDGAATEQNQVIGLETRVAIYAGKPIRIADLGPRALVERNQIVALSYSAGSLNILTEGRALARGGVGETIEVMNLSSRSKVTGQIGPDGIVRVTPAS